MVNTVIKLHEALLPAVIKTSGPKATRDYLRGLAQNGGRFAGYASAKLISIDRDILGAYRAQAQAEWNAKHWAGARAALQTIIDEYPDTTAAEQAKLDLRKVTIAQYSDEAAIALAAKDFDGVRAKYRQISSEYPDSEEAAWADGEAAKVVPVEVTFYKDQGDAAFKTAQPAQFETPQTEAAEFYRKMYQADPDGPQAAVALYGWSRALGTQGQWQQAIPQLQQLVAKFPDSPQASHALFLIGFYQGSAPSRQYDAAIQTMQQVMKNYPKSEDIPEAMWYLAYYYGLCKHDYKEGLPYLQLLAAQFPNSPRSKYVPKWIANFQKRMTS